LDARGTAQKGSEGGDLLLLGDRDIRTIFDMWTTISLLALWRQNFPSRKDHFILILLLDEVRAWGLSAGLDDMLFTKREDELALYQERGTG
jgi:hypothetical protein